jgi:peptide/nickel transport system substrate-binding protein
MEENMMGSSKRIVWPAALAALLVAGLLAGCGSSESGVKNGGTVTLFEVAGGVDSLDPGYWYYQTDYTDLGQTTQRWLYGWTPTSKTPVPDIAVALPVVSGGGKTLTIHIRTGVHYSPPLQSREVVSADVKYAMERCFLSSVANGYSGVYYSNIVGAPSEQVGKVPDISGIRTPNSTTLVIETKVPVGVLADGDALALPCTIPVPRSYAERYDLSARSSYGDHELFTGPYMIAGAGGGAVPNSGYQLGKLLVLVRNPSWRRSSDPIRPAHFNKIVFSGGNDITLASTRILGGTSMMSGDFAAPPPAILQQGLASRRGQFQIVPSGGVRFISLDTKIKPLDNVDFRRAIAAVLDRNALRLTRGGAALGTLATHFIPPEIPGFEQAGGASGPGYDFYAHPSGDLALAESYMRRAGYPSGKYTGPPLLTVADNEPPARDTAEAVQSQLAKIGISLTLREVPHATAYSKFCLVPAAAVAICPNLGWGKDFFDAQSLIDPVFNGKNIISAGNTNTSQANNPLLNAQMDAAERLVEPAARAAAWGKLDREITGEVFVVPWLWDNEVGFHSSNVVGVQWNFNGGDWDLTASSLK